MKTIILMQKRLFVVSSKIFPESKSATASISFTGIIVLPFKICHCTGAKPLPLGNSDSCITRFNLFCIKFFFL